MGQSRDPIHITGDGVEGRALEPLPIEPADFETPPTAQSWAIAHADEALGLTVGVWTTSDMKEAFGPYPGDEFMAVLEGETRLIEADGGETLVRAGEAFCVHNRHPVSWKQVGSMRKIFMIHDPPGAVAPDAAPAGPGVVVWSADETGAADGSVEADGPLQRSVRFTTGDGLMTAGSVEIAPHDDRQRPAGPHELLFISAGAVRIADEGGRDLTLGAGEAVFLPADCSVRTASTAGAQGCFARRAAG
ncbi:MAG: hypothetical protein NXI21_02600 [Alphaproteobacteria bacterium]|nr:hypothetical protein [Alphaproteobacteria bacterium]